MISNDTSLMAHLLRRAGFGASRDELEQYLEMGYDGAVEALLHPSDPGNMPDDLIRRYHVEQSELRDLAGSNVHNLGGRLAPHRGIDAAGDPLRCSSDRIIGQVRVPLSC